MLKIITVEAIDDYRLRLIFNDCTSGTVDLSTITRDGVFEPWSDPAFFRRVSIDPESGSVTWPGEIDLDTYVLYAQALGLSIEEVLESV